MAKTIVNPINQTTVIGGVKVHRGLSCSLDEQWMITNEREYASLDFNMGGYVGLRLIAPSKIESRNDNYFEREKT